MRNVVAEMLAPTRVIQPRHGDSGQASTAKRKDVVGRVVQQKSHMGRTVRVEPDAVQRCETLRFGQKLAVCPHAVAEPQGRTIGVPGIRAIATQERRRVRSGERHLGQRWSEPGERRGGCHLSPGLGLGVRPHRPMSPRPGHRSP